MVGDIIFSVTIVGTDANSVDVGIVVKVGLEEILEEISIEEELVEAEINVHVVHVLVGILSQVVHIEVELPMLVVHVAEEEESLKLDVIVPVFSDRLVEVEMKLEPVDVDAGVELEIDEVLRIEDVEDGVMALELVLEEDVEPIEVL